MKKEIDITIVGLSYYIDDYETYVNNLAAGTQVAMIAEPSNPYDRNAIKAFIGGKHVGYVSRDMAKEVLNYLRQNNGVLIGTVTEAMWKEIHIKIDIERFETVEIKKEPLFDNEAALNENLIAPMLCDDEKFLMNLSLSEYYLQLGLLSEDVKTVLEEVINGMHNSISCESTLGWLKLTEQINNLIASPKENTLQEDKEYLGNLVVEMHEYNKDRVRFIEEIYSNKYNRLQIEAFKADGALSRILKSEFGNTEPDSEQAKQLCEKMERFLLTLPNNNYRLLYDKKAEWAKALMYLRPSLKELYIICTHAIVLEWAKARISAEKEKHFDIRDLSLAMIDREKIFNSRLDREKLINLHNRMKVLIAGFGEKADYAWLFMACCNLSYLHSQNGYTAFAKTLCNWQVSDLDISVISSNIKINVTKVRERTLDPERMKQVMKTIADYENFIK